MSSGQGSASAVQSGGPGNGEIRAETEEDRVVQARPAVASTSSCRYTPSADNVQEQGEPSGMSSASDSMQGGSEGSSSSETAARVQTEQQGLDEPEQAASKGPAGPLSLVVQGPDGAFFVGTERLERTAKGSGCHQEQATPTDGQREQTTEFFFAPASESDPQGFEAVHIIFPDLPPRPEQTTIDIRGLEAILSPQQTNLFLRRKRCFVFLLLIGSGFYVAVFVAGLVDNHRKAGTGGGSSGSSMTADLDYLAHQMLTSSNTWVALVYLVLYLSLDMIAFAGTLLENAHLLVVYMLVETIITCISALESIKPYLIFRVVIILLGYQVYQSIVLTNRALRRLHFRLTGQELPNQYISTLESFGIPATRIGAVLERYRPSTVLRRLVSSRRQNSSV